MVKLTVDLIVKLCFSHNKRKTDETIEHYLNRVTHLYLQDKIIDEIVNIFYILKFMQTFFSAESI